MNGYARCRRSPRLLAIVLLVIANGCARPRPPSKTVQVFSGTTMGTRYTVKVARMPAGVDPAGLEAAIRAVLASINAGMSTYDPDSELSRANRAQNTDWIPVSLDTASVLLEALRIGRLSEGAFDVTVAPLVRLWGFGAQGRRGGEVPTEAEMERAKRSVGIDKVEARIAPPALRKRDPGLTIDLSGIAKGFAVDQVAELLERRGIGRYMVEIGGEIRARGRNDREIPWQIAIEKPTPGLSSVQRVIPVDGLAMATSGDYRDFFERDGVRYCHVLDPRSGQPIRHTLVSVSVLADRCATADAWATALLVLGPEDGYRLATKHHLAALLIVRSNGLFIERATPAFHRFTEGQPRPASGNE